VLLLGSGTWLALAVYGGWAALAQPWLAGMIGLFAFEFIEGNTITRLYFMRLRRLTRAALAAGRVTPELKRARGELVPTFTHFLDLPLLFLIIALGAMQPTTWSVSRSIRAALRSFPRKRESSSFHELLGPRFRGDERRANTVSI
jgi:hypothetical protein